MNIAHNSISPVRNQFLWGPLSSATWVLGLLVILLLGIAVAFSGISIPPIEAHEAFVLLAAQGMYDHKDWVVPWFNGEPHLTKPPLSYWLTAFFAWISGSLDQIQPWHARVPSALAGVGIIFLTAVSGKKLFDETTGLLAALMVASSAGYFNYTHSARPEMLYAFLCAAALTLYVYVRSEPLGGGRQRLGANAIWLLFALATLTKGPQLPAMLLLMFILDCRRRDLGLKSSVLFLQPISGIIVFAAVAAPWWWLLHHRLGGAGLAGTQLSGSLLTINPLKALNPYYLYRPLQLLVPWMLFLPAITYLSWRKWPDHLWLLAMVIVLPAVMLSFGPQKRWYYMLPALMPMCLLLAAGMVEFFRNKIGDKRWTKYLHWLLLLPAIAFAIIGNTSYAWSNSRFSQQRLAFAARDEVKAGHDLIAWSVTPEIFVYYTGHSVRHVHSISQLEEVLANASHKQFTLLLETQAIAKLPSSLQFRVLRQSDSEEDEPISLLLINT